MGLCKCPKHKVTQLFCFEHNVNVCEDCLVNDHERCIVQSYVQWLQDSDYSPVCTLCNELLAKEPTVRLICYDVFHWSCLDKYAKSLPANTAPAGYQCPRCKVGIFPPANMVSPLANALRKRLSTVSWARAAGLGDDAGDTTSHEQHHHPHPHTNKLPQEPLDNIKKNTSMTNFTASDDDDFIVVSNQKKQQQQQQSKAHQELHNAFNQPATSGGGIRQLQQLNSSDVSVSSNLSQTYDDSVGMILNISNLDRDSSEYKYQRRPLLEWLNRWLKSRQLIGRNSPFFRMTRQKRILFIILIVILGFLTLIIVFSRLASITNGDEDDPAFDPLNNPNIRVQ